MPSKFATGIYAIRNKKTRKCYVGSAAEIEKRWGVHRCQLRKNKHHNTKLQRSWNKHGENYFTFRILERCSLRMLAKREQYWMNHYDAHRNGYNAHPIARTARGHKFGEIALENIRAGAVRRAACPVERQLRSERAKAQHAAGTLGRKTWSSKSEETFSKKMKTAFKDGRMSKFEAVRDANTKTPAFREMRRKNMRAFALANPEEMGRRSMLRKDRNHV